MKLYRRDFDKCISTVASLQGVGFERMTDIFCSILPLFEFVFVNLALTDPLHTATWSVEIK